MLAPTFSLPDQYNKIHNLTDYKGKWVVLYFYPKDNTPGCTKEACNFRDNLDEFKKKGVIVLGVSKDSINSHTKFSNKFNLNFPILSDENLTTIKAYNTWGKKKFMGREFQGILRKTFLINPKGEIEKEYPKVDVTQHALEILHDIEILDK